MQFSLIVKVGSSDISLWEINLELLSDEREIKLSSACRDKVSVE